MSPETELILADAHVHIHECFNLNDALDSAHNNFLTVARQLSAGPHAIGALFLTESSTADYYAHMVNSRKKRECLDWRFEATEEPISLIARKNGSMPIVVIAGRQIVTAERLEVLALGAANEHPDGQPIRDVLQGVTAANAIPVIPWGFGKWMGRRGRILRALLEDSTVPSFYLGDNSGRPAFIPNPREFDRTRTDAGHILSGSDPLPFPSECTKPGSFGFSLRSKIDLEHPMQSLSRAIRNPATDVRGFGTPETAMRFIHHQVKMQIRLRQRRAGVN